MKKKASENIIDEAKLIRLLRKGSEEAFGKVFHMHFQMLYQYSLQFLKSRQDAEDVVQEAFIRLWMHRDRIISESSLKSFLFVTTRNLLITRFNRNLSSPTFEDYLEYCNVVGSEDVSRIEYEEFLENLNRCIDELPPHQSRVVRMSKIEQLSNREIAEILGINEQSVKNNLSLGLKYIRSKLILLIIAIVLIFS